MIKAFREAVHDYLHPGYMEKLNYADELDRIAQLLRQLAVELETKARQERMNAES